MRKHNTFQEYLSASKLAQALDITKGAVSQWDAVPLSRVIEVEAATGIHRSELRPDFFGEVSA